MGADEEDGAEKGRESSREELTEELMNANEEGRVRKRQGTGKSSTKAWNLRFLALLLAPISVH